MLVALAHTLTALSLSVTSGLWPLDPQPPVVQRFAPPAEKWHSGHRGVDLLGRPGQVVRTALPGRVTFAGAVAGKGVVVVSHGAARTTYEPVDPSVRVGAMVDQGGRIGRLTAAASHCWPRACLHWGLVEGERYLDPLDLVGAGQVRLLPATSGPGGAGRLPPLLPGWALPRLVPTPLTPPPVPLPTPIPMPSPPTVRFARPAGGPAGTPGEAGQW